MPTLYKFGKDKISGETVFIQDTTNGLSCECVCFECEMPFIAVQGEKNEWHFRHSVETNCIGGQETALHKLAKKIIAENSEMALPKYGIVTYNNTVQEKYFQTIIPDVTATTADGQNIFFEVLVTHPVDKEKEIFYKTGYKSVEINLNGYVFTTLENLENEILKVLERKQIIFWENEEVKQSNIWNWIIGGIIALLVFLGLRDLFSPTKKRNRYR